MTPSLKNICLLTVAVFAITIQVWLCVVNCLLSHIPVADSLSLQVYPEWHHMLHPEREAQVFHGFVLLVIAAECVALALWRRRLSQGQPLPRLTWYALVNALLAISMLAAAFKSIVYAPRSQLSEVVLIGLGIASVLINIALSVRRWTMPRFKCRAWQVDLMVLCALVLVIFIPHPKAVVARMFLGEQVHHYDSALATPGWAYISGSRLDVDVISQYGLGMPILVAILSKALGGFSYVSSLIVLMWGTIVYFALWYMLLRLWIKDQVLCCACLALAIATQMFHGGAYPITFTYPSTTIWRYVFDVVFFLLIYVHLTRRQLWALWMSGACVGMAIVHVTTTGYCLALTLIAYLVLDAIEFLRNTRVASARAIKVFESLMAVGLVALAWALLMRLWIGPLAFSHQFWSNLNEFNNYFLSGFGAEPMVSTLIQRQIYPGVLGFAVPVVLMLIVVIGMSLAVFLKLDRRHWLAILLSSYGVLLFHYYVGRAVAANVFVVALPAIAVLCYGVSLVPLRSVWKWVMLSMCVASLVTSHNFIAYPNVLNVSRNPVIDPLVFAPLPDGRSYFNHLFSQLPQEGRLPTNSLGEVDEQIKTEHDFNSEAELAAYFDEEFDFAKDASLIDRLVPAHTKVAIISSFETQILIQANRPPFFYYSPLVISRLMRIRTFPVTALYTSAHLQRTIDQINSEKPPYIFVERIFSADNISRANYKDGSAFMALMKFVYAHYEPGPQGHYLMALKRKSND